MIYWEPSVRFSTYPLVCYDCNDVLVTICWHIKKLTFGLVRKLQALVYSGMCDNTAVWLFVIWTIHNFKMWIFNLGHLYGNIHCHVQWFIALRKCILFDSGIIYSTIGLNLEMLEKLETYFSTLLKYLTLICI